MRISDRHPAARGYQFIQRLTEVFRTSGTAGDPVVFITEHGRYIPFDIRPSEDREGHGETQILLLEEGK